MRWQGHLVHSLKQTERHITLAMTGASGAGYGLKLVQQLHAQRAHLHLLFSDAARIVLREECSLTLPEQITAIPATLADFLSLASSERLHCYGLKDWFSPTASGSSGVRQMVIAPCSMGTLARIAQGISDNLIERSADVMIKEKGQLIIMPRETPLSAIHLQHMLSLAQLGVEIIPAMPGFYHRPASVDDLQRFMVERIMDHLHMPQINALRWGSKP